MDLRGDLAKGGIWIRLRSRATAGSFFGPFRARLLWGVVAVLVGAIATAIVVALPWTVRRKATAAGLARGLNVQIASVRPAWGAVVLRDVSVSPVDPVQNTSVRIRLATVRVAVSGLGAGDVVVEGGTAEFTGSAEALRDQLHALRAHRTEQEPASAKGGRTLRAGGIHASWDGGGDCARTVVADGVGGEHGARDEDALRWNTLTVGTCKEPENVHASMRLTSRGGTLEGAHGVLSRADIDAVEIHLLRGHVEAEHATMQPLIKRPSSANLAAEPTQAGRQPSTVPEGAPFQLPSAAAARAALMKVGELLATKLPKDATVHLGALKLEMEEQGKAPLVLGPGPLQIARNGAATTLSYMSRASDEPVEPGQSRAAELTARVELPTAGDPVFFLDGGPVTLGQMGLAEKTLGLVDVDRATVAGKATVTFAETGIAFDGRLDFVGVGLDQPRVASDVIHGISFSVGGRGTQENHKRITLEAGYLSFGAATVNVRGELLHPAAGPTNSTAQPPELTGNASFDLSTTSCNGLLGGIPRALVPTLKDAHMTGTFAAHGTLAFDTSNLDRLDLRWLIDDRCQLVDVPEELRRSHFTVPFSHRIYHRDGSIGEEETGPGSGRWASLEEISPYMQVAVLTTEDGGFFRHHGFHFASIKAALIANLKAHKFIRGASTISMQLAKNLFLSRKKVLSRKLEELILTDYLESDFQKHDIMELYLNVIEFGPDIYGIRQAAEHYFGREPSELSAPEAFFLATLLPSPIKHHAAWERGKLSEGALAHIHALLRIAQKRGNLSGGELAAALTQPVIFHRPGDPPPQPRDRPSNTRFEGGGDDEEVPPLEPPTDLAE